MGPEPSARWRAVDGEALAWHDWGGQIVVFNQETGSTHLLNDLAGAVLRRLVAIPCDVTIDALAAEFADDPSCADRDAWSAAIAEVLSDFTRLGLARPA